MNKYILLVLTGLIFGSQFLFTKYALGGLTAMQIAVIRTVFGALTLIILAPFFKNVATPKQPGHIPWTMYALIGFLEGVLPVYLVPLGQQQVSSAVTAVLISTMPIFAIIFGSVLVKSEKFTLPKVAAIIIGFIGVYILIKPAHATDFLHELLPESYIILASASWGLSLVLIKKQAEINPFVMTRNIFFAATLEIIPLWFILGHPLQMKFSLWPMFCAVLIGVFASGVVYVFYVLLIRYSGVAFAAFSNYIVPIVGVLLGIFVLNDTFYWHELIGLVIIIAALAIQAWPVNKKVLGHPEF